MSVRSDVRPGHSGCSWPRIRDNEGMDHTDRRAPKATRVSPSLAPGEIPKRTTMGRSVQGRPIVAHQFDFRCRRTRLILAGMHGDEPKSVYVADNLLDWLWQSVGCTHLNMNLVIVTIVNPDGYANRNRRNANRVDINRNFPTSNWRLESPRRRMFGGVRASSEPETRAVIKAVKRFHPTDIITIHSINQHRHCNNYDGPAKRLATMMGRLNKYPVRATIGYPTPGSFGTWAGVERHIATVTLELPSHRSPQQCWQDNRLALLAGTLNG